MNKKYFLILFLLLIIPLFTTLGDNAKIDSIRKEIEKAEHDTVICKLYNDIGNIHRFQEPDTALKYFYKSLRLAESKGYKRQEATASRQIGVIFSNKGNYAKSLEYYFRALDIAEELELNYVKSRCFNDIGVVYHYQGNYDNALKFYLRAIDIAEQLDYDTRIAGCHNNIGIIHHEQDDFDKAIDHHSESLEIHRKLADEAGMSTNFNNLGIVYGDKGEMLFEQGDYAQAKENFETAVEYHNESLKIKKEYQDKRGISMSYNNIANIHTKQGNLFYARDNKTKAKQEFDKAAGFFQQSLEIDIELEDKHGQAIVKAGMANLYINLTKADTITKRESNLQKAIDHAFEAYMISKEIGSLLPQNRAEQLLKDAYGELNMFKEALKYAEKYISTKDSMFSLEKTQALAEMQTRYETEQKQQEIENQKLIIERQEIESNRQKNFRNFLIAGATLLALLLLLIYRSYQQKKRSNYLISKKNILLEQANEEINTQKEELTSQYDMVIKQKKQIEKQNDQITKSINYAWVIQNAVLPTKDETGNILGEHLILYKPKEIVSGDFYWATKIDRLLIFAVADCTGHGVPGAFMSMLGVSLLKEIVNKKEITNPGEALNKLRDSIIEALHQKENPQNINEGMDIALSVLDTKDYSLEYAGANSPLIIISANKEWERIAPSKQSISLQRRMKPFANQKLQLQKNDCIYLISDGYQDQFGGPNNKMFMSRNLKKLLLDISDKPMTEQKEILDQRFEEWKGQHDQIDDVTILGIRV